MGMQYLKMLEVILLMQGDVYFRLMTVAAIFVLAAILKTL